MNERTRRHGAPISHWPFRRRWLFSPGQELLRRWFPEVGEYGIPDRAELEVRADWIPNVDMINRKESVEVRVDLPGVRPEDISLKVENGVLWLRGERRLEEEEDSESSYFCCERESGTFARVIRLPDTVDPENVITELRDGVLKLTFQKKAESKPRKIEIKVN